MGCEDVGVVEGDLAFGCWDEPEDGASRGGFAAARFADEAERFAGLDVEGDVVDRFDVVDGALEDASSDGEPDAEVVDGEEVGLVGGGLRLWCVGHGWMLAGERRDVDWAEIEMEVVMLQRTRRMAGLLAGVVGGLVGGVLVCVGCTTTPVRLGDSKDWITIREAGMVAQFLGDRDRLVHFGERGGANLIYVEPSNHWKGPDPTGGYRFMGGLYTWISPQSGPLGWRDESGELSVWPPDPKVDRGPVRATAAGEDFFTVTGPMTRFGLREVKTFKITGEGRAEFVYTLENPTAEARTGGQWINQAVRPGAYVAVRDAPVASLWYQEPGKHEDRFESLIVERRDGWMVIDTGLATGGGYKVYLDGPAEIAVWDRGRWLHRKLTPPGGQRLIENEEGPVALWLDGEIGLFEAELYGPLLDVPALGSSTVRERWRVIASGRPSVEGLVSGLVEEMLTGVE